MTQTNEIKKIHVKNEVFIEEIRRMLQNEGRKSVTFIVRGVSMRPFLEHERDKVILTAPQPPAVGQVVLAEFRDKIYAMHRIIKIEGDKITMRGDGNLLKQTETFTTDRIIGTAEAFIRKGKYVSTKSRKWRIYSALWQTLAPIRRILLAIDRRIFKKHKSYES